MGDRVYTTFDIHGRIETVEALNAILEAIEGNGFYDVHERFGKNPEGHRELIIETLVSRETCIQLHDSECNYGNTDELQEACKEHGLSYYTSWEAGGGFEASHSVYIHGVGDFDGEEAKLDCGDIEKILAEPDPVAALQGRLKKMRQAAGVELPDLEWSQEVMDHLAVEAGRRAVLAA